MLRAAVASIVAALALRYLGGMSVISPTATLVTGGVGVLLMISGLESWATG
jgi:hypothetical protein